MQRDGSFVAAPVKHALDRFGPDKPAEGDEAPEAAIPDLRFAEPGEQAVLLRSVHEDRLAAEAERVSWPAQSQGRCDRIRVGAQHHDKLRRVIHNATVGRRLSRQEEARSPRQNLEACDKV